MPRYSSITTLPQRYFLRGRYHKEATCAGALLAVSTEGDWPGWIRYFLAAVAHQAADAADRAQRLQALREDMRGRVLGTRSSALPGRLVDELFDIPAITITKAARLLGVTHRTARLTVAKLVDAGVLIEVGDRSRNKLFLAEEVLKVVEGGASDP